MSILVLGSFVMDQVVSTPRAPENGETIIGNSFAVFPGGKGANQAVTAARLGGTVTMAGKVGDDAYGETFLKVLKEEGIDNSFVEVDKENGTGVGFVTLEENGDNRIIVVPGANLKYTKEELAKLDAVLDETEILIIQLEMDLDVMEEAIKMAQEKGVKVIANPAPGQVLSDKFLSYVDYLTPNETELEILTGMPVNNVDDTIEASKYLLNKGIDNIIVTLGDNGALVVTPDFVEHVEGYQVEVRDTVAAGDSFNGALAVSIVEGVSLQEAVKLANATGALTVTKDGAIPSIPSREEVEDFIKKAEIV